MYKSSGLAEIVREPSAITRQYLERWFTGKGAYGQVLKSLGWPVCEDERPILVWDQQHGLRIDLKVEEKVMYGKTVLRYRKSKQDYQLALDFTQFFSLKKIFGTTQAIWSQSKLLLNYQNTYVTAANLVKELPIKTRSKLEDIEKALVEEVWPRVVAVDYLGEFIYEAMTHKLNEQDKAKLINKLHPRISKRDWYTKAMIAWGGINDTETKISKEEFVTEYGFAAGDDYELTSPRFYEILKMPKPMIRETPIEKMEINNLEDLYVGIQYLRSEAKRRSLVWISALRDLRIQKE